jgi:hypothetical protein
MAGPIGGSFFLKEVETPPNQDKTIRRRKAAETRRG